MKKKKVAIIGTVGIPAKYGGFETLVEHLTKVLSNNIDFTVYCSSKAYAKKSMFYQGAKLVYLPFDANGKESLLYDAISVVHALKSANVLLLLGVGGGIMLPFVKLFTRKKVLVNIDGLEWKRDKWGKKTKWLLKSLEKLCVQFSDIVIVDNKAIQEYVSVEYKLDSKLIEYGGDHTFREAPANSLLQNYGIAKSPYAFSVCRIEPENNIEIILKAFSNSNIPLLFVGNWGINEYGRKLKGIYKGYKNLFLLDPIYDQNKLNQLRSNASLYIHGHSAGGTNPSLVEAMTLELPVICWDVAYNRYTTGNKAIYFHSHEDLRKKVGDLFY
ncbi:DUF1972 domain-containing protein, partial [Xanthovirga aplysinae]|uniref:DUF1972 domain-containing protein n=1 Tax=Xanthovirga aplysinae TaxID=2529853 RepID=UPI0012BB9BC3